MEPPNKGPGFFVFLKEVVHFLEVTNVLYIGTDMLGTTKSVLLEVNTIGCPVGSMH